MSVASWQWPKAARKRRRRAARPARTSPGFLIPGEEFTCHDRTPSLAPSAGSEYKFIGHVIVGCGSSDTYGQNTVSKGEGKSLHPHLCSQNADDDEKQKEPRDREKRIDNPHDDFI